MQASGRKNIRSPTTETSPYEAKQVRMDGYMIFDMKFLYNIENLTCPDGKAGIGHQLKHLQNLNIEPMNVEY